MSTKFENIFEKFNINCKGKGKSRKFVHQRKQSFKLDKHLLSLPLNKSSTFQKTNFCGQNACNESNSSENSNSLRRHSLNQSNTNHLRSQAVFNETKKWKSLRDGYCNSLNVVVLQKSHRTTNYLEEHHRENYISNDSFKLTDEESGTVGERQTCNYFRVSMKKLPFTCSFNLKNTISNRGRKHIKLSQFKPLDISVIPKRHSTSIKVNKAPLKSEKSILNSMPLTDFEETPDKLFTPTFLSSSSKSIQFMETSASIDKSDDKRFTELSTFTELIERDKPPKVINENTEENQSKFKANLNKVNVEQFSPCLSGSPKPSQFIESSASTQTSEDPQPTELDLLLDLIEREERSEKINDKKIKKKNKFKALNGRYEQLFQRALTLETTRCRFLEYDRKLGVQTGQLLRVVDIHTFFKATFAIVESDISIKHFAIVIPHSMLSFIKIGAKLEAFFDDTAMPYNLEINNEILDVYLEPYKLLVL